MIIKKKINQLKSFNIFKNIIYKLIFSIGILSILLIIFFTFYYVSSGMYQRFSPINLIKKADKVILNKYLGFSIYEIDDYLSIKFSLLKYQFIKNKLENVTIRINQKNIYNLELQRKNKIDGSSGDFETYSTAILKHNNNNYNIKLRVKGERVLHWYNKDETSYKIDLRGKDRIWGMEEFSVQKPITRNYVYEFIFHKLLKFNELLSLNYFFINLSLNDNDQGIYAVEEGLSKELIERNKKRNGPIFGLEEKLGTDYPYVQYDLYSKDYWIKNYPLLVANALAKLNNLKKNKIDIDEIFDLEKWANFFAIIDLSRTLHGSLSKSVKLYYNPVTAKFEPIGLDGHFGLGPNVFVDFLVLDFLDQDNKNCSFICHDREWYLRFFKNQDGSNNTKFLNLYIKALKKVSSQKFLSNFEKKYLKEIQFFNSQLLSDVSKKDVGYYKGIGDFIYNDKFLAERARYIQNRLNEINELGNLQTSLNDNQIIFDNINNFFFKKLKIECENKQLAYIYILKDKKVEHNKSCNYFVGKTKIKLYKNIFISTNFKSSIEKSLDLSKNKNIKYIDNNYYLTKDLIIKKNYHFPKNKKLYIKEGLKIYFENDVSIISEGSIFFQGTKEKPIIIYGDKGKGSIILSNNDYSFNNVIVENLSFPKNNNKILYGGINIINSNFEFLNSEITSSNSEDAINIISSNSFIKNLKMSNIKADAIDVDFGKLVFENIHCKNILNDCLDVSGVNINGKYLYATDVSDKGLSFGENSKGTISNTNFKKNKLGVAVKDGSKLTLLNNNLENNKFDIAVFNKKKEYNSSTLKLVDVNSENDLNILLGENNEILSPLNLKIKKVKNSYINNLFY